MHLQAESILSSLFVLLNEEKVMEDIRPDEKVIQTIDKEPAFSAQATYHDNKKSQISRIIFTVLPILSNYSVDNVLNEGEV